MEVTFFSFICDVVTRSVFILISLIGVWRVVWVKHNGLYWLLTILYLPLVVELILTLRRRRRKNKWFSPAIFLFLISIIPSIWILELHHQENRLTDSQCEKWSGNQNSSSGLFRSWSNKSYEDILKEPPLSELCAKDWILALHQILLILLILGKWLLPVAGELDRDKLSKLLLIFVGTAADLLEFTSETMSDISDRSPVMVHIILAVWTWSMLQFPLHLSVMDGSPEEAPEDAPSCLSHLGTDIWSTVEALFIQDGPFLVVRLVVMMHFKVVHQMLIFFAIKNLLVVILNIYRLSVLVVDRRS